MARWAAEAPPAWRPSRIDRAGLRTPRRAAHNSGMRRFRSDLTDRDVTPFELYMRRREFLALGAASLIGPALAASPLRSLAADPAPSPANGAADSALPPVVAGPYGTDEKQTPLSRT